MMVWTWLYTVVLGVTYGVDVAYVWTETAWAGVSVSGDLAFMTSIAVTWMTLRIGRSR